MELLRRNISTNYEESKEIKSLKNNKLETYTQKKERLRKSKETAKNTKSLIRNKPIIRLKMGEGSIKNEIEGYRANKKPEIIKETKLPRKRKLSELTTEIGVLSDEGVSVLEIALKAGITKTKVREKISVWEKYKEINI